MGDPRKLRKRFQGPGHPWKKSTIEDEKALVREYALKKKEELWKSNSLLSRFKRQVKRLVALKVAQAEKERSQLLSRLKKLGVVPENAKFDDVLALNTSNILDRRLQSVVYKRGLARSMRQARQVITHQHITISGKKVTAPGYLVDTEEENHIQYSPGSSLFNPEHPERAVAAKKDSEEKRDENEGSIEPEKGSAQSKKEDSAKKSKDNKQPEKGVNKIKAAEEKKSEAKGDSKEVAKAAKGERDDASEVEAKAGGQKENAGKTAGQGKAQKSEVMKNEGDFDEKSGGKKADSPNIDKKEVESKEIDIKAATKNVEDLGKEETSNDKGEQSENLKKPKESAKAQENGVEPEKKEEAEAKAGGSK